MANKTVYEIIAKAIGFGKTDKSVKTLSGSMKRFATGLVTTAAAYRGFTEAVEAVKLAGKLEGVENAFNNLRKEAGFSIGTFNKLDKALNGTADRLTIMEQANNAMLLGIADSEEQMAEMFDIAQRLSQALGNTAEFGIESLVTGLGRQSKLMLDNLGIMVDVEGANKNYAESLGVTASQLTDSQRKQAFINEALQQGKNLVEGLGEEQLTTAQTIESLIANFTDLKVAIGEALVDIGAIDSINTFVTALKGLLEIRRNEAQIAENATTKYGNQTEIIKELEAQYQFLVQQQNLLKNSTIEVGTGIRSFSTNADAAREALDKYNMANKENTELMEENRKEMEMLQDEIKLRKDRAEEIAEIESDIARRKKEEAEAQIQIEQEQAAILAKLEKEADKRELKRQKRIKDRIAAEKENKKMILQTLDSMKIISDQLGIDNKALEKVTIAHAVANTFAGATKALAQGGLKGFAGAAAVVAAGMQNVERIKQSYQSYEEGGLIGGNRHSQGGTIIEEIEGEFIMSRNAVENIGVDTLETMNAGGGSVVVNVTGNVMSEDFVENELADKISIAVKRGVDFGIV